VVQPIFLSPDKKKKEEEKPHLLHLLYSSSGEWGREGLLGKKKRKFFLSLAEFGRAKGGGELERKRKGGGAVFG